MSMKNAFELPEIAVFIVRDITMDGEIIAAPFDDDALKSMIDDDGLIVSALHNKTCAKDDLILVRLKTGRKGIIKGQIIRVMGAQKTKRILARVFETKKGMMAQPLERRAKDDYIIQDPPEGLEPGHLIEVDIIQNPGRRALSKPIAHIANIIGHDDDPKAISLIAMAEKGLQSDFPDAVLTETQGMKVPAVGNREDIRDIPLVTIDGADARDFDDAVWATPTDNGGFHIIVAIADVAHYVREGTALAREAYHRGNSTYFPDRVVPMLPEALSNDLCSLRPKENRACMGFHLWIDSDGNLTNYRVFRGLMRSEARLTYDQVQAALDGVTDSITDVICEPLLRPMHAAYKILEKARAKRGALDLDMPERQILIDDGGSMSGVTLRSRYDAHKMIEEFMILANVAAAQALEAKNAPCIYRIHDQPDSDRIDNASNFLDGFGLKLAKGNVPKPIILNGILKKVEGENHAPLVNDIILRTQSQAVYSPDNIGHYGLALTHYAHFTSPIRRYADLIVHRALITAYELGDDGLTQTEAVTLAKIADHISKTERTSMEAERSAVDRFTASYLETRIGAEFTGRISGVTRFGLFVRLDDNGADGLVPIRSLPDDFYIHDEKSHALIGRKNKLVFRLCAPVRVVIREADRFTGSTVFVLADPYQGAEIPGFVPPVLSSRGMQKLARRKDNAYQSRNDRRPQKGKKNKGDDFKTKKKKKKTTPKHKRKKK